MLRHFPRCASTPVFLLKPLNFLVSTPANRSKTKHHHSYASPHSSQYFAKCCSRWLVNVRYPCENVNTPSAALAPSMCWRYASTRRSIPLAHASISGLSCLSKKPHTTARNMDQPVSTLATCSRSTSPRCCLHGSNNLKTQSPINLTYVCISSADAAETVTWSRSLRNLRALVNTGPAVDRKVLKKDLNSG